MSGDLRDAVIGRSEGEPTPCRMDRTRERAERLRERREAAGTPCFVATMQEWRADPMAALRRAGGPDGG